MAGLCTPRPTLRLRPHGRRRTAWGRCGSLLLHRSGLAPPTPCRSPGALRLAAQARREAARLMHGPGHAQALRHVRRLRTFLGRLHREIARKLAGRPDLEAAFATARERVAR